MLINQLMRLHRLCAPEGGDGAGSGGGNAGGGAGGAGKGGEGAGSGDHGAGAGAGDSAGSGTGDKGKSLMETLGKGEGGADKGAGDGSAAKDGEGKALDTPEAKALAASEKDTRRPKDVPAKYWDAEKGEVMHGAWAKSTTELETRMRTVGLPPKDAAEYKFEVPKPLKDIGFDLDPAQAKGFRERALALGLTQKQFEGVMGDYFAQIPALADQVSGFSTEKAKTELLAYYKTEEAMNENVRAAYQAFMAYADENDQAMIDQIGNIPAVVRILAKVHRDMREDPGVNPDAILDGESLETLMRGSPGAEDSPYWNADDPRHKSVKAKVMAHHEATAKARQRKAA